MDGISCDVPHLRRSYAAQLTRAEPLTRRLDGACLGVGVRL